jgi:hypothetical protein
MTDETTPTPETAKPTHGDETFEWTDESGDGTSGSGGSTGREWLAQLQTMIENAATQATPVMRQVAAKAAELAAVAGEKAGPVAARAAELTAGAGQRIADRSRGLATELRRDQADAEAKAAAAKAAKEGTDAASGAGDTARVDTGATEGSGSTGDSGQG